MKVKQEVCNENIKLIQGFTKDSQLRPLWSGDQSCKKSAKFIYASFLVETRVKDYLYYFPKKQKNLNAKIK